VHLTPFLQQLQRILNRCRQLIHLPSLAWQLDKLPFLVHFDRLPGVVISSEATYVLEASYPERATSVSEPIQGHGPAKNDPDFNSCQGPLLPILPKICRKLIFLEVFAVQSIVHCPV